MEKKESLTKRIFLLALPLAIFMLFLLFPFYEMLITSLKPGENIEANLATLWPHNATLEAYRTRLTSVSFMRPMLNSFIVAAITVVVSLTVSTLAAYSFSRYRFKGRKVLMIIFLMNNMFPTVLLLIPLYTIMRTANLLYTPWALVLSYTTFTIPFSVWLMNGFLNDLPLSIEEAAMVDGASRSKAFIKIILPILVPCLLATGVYIFMQSWNEYTFAVLFTNENNRTVPVALKMLIGENGTEWEKLTAGGIITVLPVCIMFFFAQKQLVSGLTAGAVKG